MQIRKLTLAIVIVGATLVACQAKKTEPTVASIESLSLDQILTLGDISEEPAETIAAFQLKSCLRPCDKAFG
jgi:hypothetical protein